MAKSSNNVFFFLLLLLHILVLALCCCFSSAAGASSQYSTDFIRTSCAATRYPSLCVRSLACYAAAVRRSPRELARFALAVSADRARSAAARVAGLPAVPPRSRSGPVRDCLENMADSVDRLRDAAAELARTGRSGSPAFAWHMSNVRTWCSAALTDETTCLDGVAQATGGKAKLDPAARAAVRREVLAVAQVTSNALALLNRVAPQQ
ncbi:21 kDa protein [Ananas comosus]|uniref:21 kDa protein n=1 Tax=Ananas comosus TaxID=4615 RepID=A0A199V9T3_ANACO|nr:21 kDa protein [Ananas comosus]